VREIIYLGGEPLLHPDLEAIIECASRWNLQQRLITNGQSLRRVNWSAMKANGLVEVGVSVHSHMAQAHDRYTATIGSWENAIETINELQNCGIAWYIQFSLLRGNVCDVCELSSFLAGRFGVDSFRMDFSRMVEDGRFVGCGDEVLREDDWGQFFTDAISLTTTGVRCSVEAVPLCWLRRLSEKKHFSYQEAKSMVRPCYAWIAQLPIDEMGNARLCPTGGPVVGNILAQGLRSTWKESPLIRSFRGFRWLGLPCITDNGVVVCEEFYECSGACRRTKSPIGICADKLIDHES